MSCFPSGQVAACFPIHRCGFRSAPRPAESALDILPGDEETMKMSYPMYTVAAEVLLKMDRLRPHERLMEQGMLVEFKKGMGSLAPKLRTSYFS